MTRKTQRKKPAKSRREPVSAAAGAPPEETAPLSEYTGSDADTTVVIIWAVVVAAILAFAAYNLIQRL